VSFQPRVSRRFKESFKKPQFHVASANFVEIGSPSGREQLQGRIEGDYFTIGRIIHVGGMIWHSMRINGTKRTAKFSKICDRQSC
jgi:hypothetical protein